MWADSYRCTWIHVHSLPSESHPVSPNFQERIGFALDRTRRRA